MAVGGDGRCGVGGEGEGARDGWVEVHCEDEWPGGWGLYMVAGRECRWRGRYEGLELRFRQSDV